jgi:transposase-like protein
MAIIPESAAYSDGEYDLKESLLQLVRGGMGFDDASLVIGLKKEKVVKWLKTDRVFNKAVMEITRRG